jgi:exodeoxyribonuclease-3
MKIVTWNVNSVKARHERLLSWLERHQPDVLCLQELKCVEEKFPALEVRALGYEFAAYGQKTYNGVAILSRTPISEVTRGFDDGVEDPQARLITAQVQGVHIICGYFPNGGEVGSDKYIYKLAWMKRLNRWVQKHCDLTKDVAICGDYNIATLDSDVNRMHEWGDGSMCSPEGREALQELREMGFIDAFQKYHPEGGVYSWWDYRQLGFPKNNGLRIDHIYATESLATRSTDAYVDRDERKGKKPSDHAPVVVEFS